MENLKYGGFKKSGDVFYKRCCVAAKMRRDGATYDDIASHLRRNRATIIYYIKRYTEVKEDPRRDKVFAEFINDFEKNQDKPDMSKKEAFMVACDLLTTLSNMNGAVADISFFAAIINAQAKKDTGTIVSMLDDVQGFISKLKKIISE